MGARTVNDIEATLLPLVQPQLEVGSAAPREVLRPPLDVEDAVGKHQLSIRICQTQRRS